MQFSHPRVLWLLVLLVPFVILAVANFRVRHTQLNGFLSATARSRMVIRGGREVDVFKTSLWIPSIALFILALAGPSWGEQLVSIEVEGTEVVFLLDTSRSMAAEDLKPKRLESGRRLITSAADALTTDYVSLVNFAGTAYVQCPLTVDMEAFSLMVNASEISPSEEQGTNLAEALETALKVLKAERKVQRMLVLITDGEDQEGGWESILPTLKEREIVVFTVGVGVAEGAPIPLRGPTGDVTDWKRDQEGQMVRSRLDEAPLKRIARETGGRYFRLADSADIDHFLAVLKGFERTVLQRRMKRVRTPRFQYPLALGIILLLVEMALTTRKIRWTKE